MITLEQAISDLKNMELTEVDKNGNPVQEGQEETCLTKSELIVFLKKTGTFRRILKTSETNSCFTNIL